MTDIFSPCEPIGARRSLRVYRGAFTPTMFHEDGCIEIPRHLHLYGYWLPRKSARNGRVLMLDDKPKARGGSFPVTVVRA